MKFQPFVSHYRGPRCPFDATPGGSYISRNSMKEQTMADLLETIEDGVAVLTLNRPEA